jgi:hypothetical protein
MRRLPIALAIALLPSIALAHGYGGHRGGWHGGYYARGGWGVRGYYVLPYFAYPNAYPVPYYPGYVPENLTYCDRNSGTYIDEDGARHLCR